MKRTSVQYAVTSSYSRNTENEQASTNVRKNSILLLTVGVLLVVALLVFIGKHSEGLLLVGLVKSGLYSTDESENCNHLPAVFFVLSSLIGLVAWIAFC